MIDTTVVMPPPPIPANAYADGSATHLRYVASSRTHSCSNEFIHIPCKPTKETSEPEDGITKQECCFAAKDIAKPAIQWLKGGQREEVTVSSRIG